MKLKKRKKSSRMRGIRTHGHSAKLNKGKGSRGGKGMSGSGKRADQKKTKVLKELYPYFGRRGFTSRKTQKKREKIINLEQIEQKKEFSGKKEIDLKDYKILGEGEIKRDVIIHAKSVSNSAREKIERAGGEIILPAKKDKKEREKSGN